MTRGIIKAVPSFGPAFFGGIDEIMPTGAAQPVTPVPGLPPAALTRPGERPGRSTASRGCTSTTMRAGSGEIPRRVGLFEIVRPAGAVDREVGGAPAEATAPA